MAAVLRTRTLSEPRGFLKMLIGKTSDRILGFTALGAEASELMAAVQTAMLGELPFTVLRDAIFTHPTAAEGRSCRCSDSMLGACLLILGGSRLLLPDHEDSAWHGISKW